MDRAIKIAYLSAIDKTAVQILRIIALKIGDEEAAFVDYKVIAAALGIKRDVVAKSVNKMVDRKLLKKENGKLSIPNSVLVAG